MAADAGSSSRFLVEVLSEPLHVARYAAAVADDAAGAVVTFAGVTRDSFEGRRVVKLEYEAYEPMAVRLLQDICRRATEQFGVKHVAIAHRLGVVPVGETSVVIAVSSAHRKAAFAGAEWAIDELKVRRRCYRRRAPRSHQRELDDDASPAAAAATAGHRSNL